MNPITLDLWIDGSYFPASKKRRQQSSAYSAFILSYKDTVLDFQRHNVLPTESHSRLSQEAEHNACYIGLQAILNYPFLHRLKTLVIHTDYKDMPAIMAGRQQTKNPTARKLAALTKTIKSMGIGIHYNFCFESCGPNKHYHVHILAKRGVTPPNLIHKPAATKVDAPTHKLQVYFNGILHKFLDKNHLDEFIGAQTSERDYYLIKEFTQRALYPVLYIRKGQPKLNVRTLINPS